ncbi:uncharacterized protein LOC126053905 [Helicoverpa armigera]|uniref:uncharacterized protein LOC126053905 n=1 Tax=Helicoverpa armigera TaxID=29058 RepID=UPI002112FF2C|nr:uncharacterized protein LOC126053905 [Helicoverpa armigera]
MASSGDQAQAPATVSGLSTAQRIPLIWRDRIRLWFAQFEAIMSPQKKGDQGMYEVLVGQLERQDLDEISDIILRPPEKNRYETLKSRLLQVYDESEQRQVQRLLSEMELGDLKPSQLLRRMKNLAADNISDSTLRVMWTNHLPQSIRAVLAVSDNIAKHSDLHELAVMADKILEQTQPPGAVAAISVPPPPHASTSTSSSIEAKIEMLIEEIAELKASQSSRRDRRSFDKYQSRSRSPSRSRHKRAPRMRSNTPRRLQGQANVCYYHRRFGADAQRCTRPCEFENGVKPTSMAGN